MEGKKTGALVCGIISIVLSSCVIGIIPAIIGLVNAKAVADAEGYVSGKAKVGKILSIVGLVLSILVILYYVGCFALGGAAALMGSY